MELELATGMKQPPCWCTQVDFNRDVLARVPNEARGQACICRACATKPTAPATVQNSPMCQLLGMNCNTPTDVMFSFTGFAQRGGRTEHKDGFGIAFFEGAGVRHFVDHQPPATRRWPSWSGATRSRAATSSPTSARRRRARSRCENTHPFVRELWGRYWVFAHNGDLKDFHPRLHAGFRPVGDTDSERAFCWLMQELAKAHAGVPSVAGADADAARAGAAASPRHGTFNFMLSNGQALWAHCSTQLYYVERQHPFAHAQLADEDVTVDFARTPRRTTASPWS